jgi:hypothetical protein
LARNLWFALTTDERIVVFSLLFLDIFKSLRRQLATISDCTYLHSCVVPLEVIRRIIALVEDRFSSISSALFKNRTRSIGRVLLLNELDAIYNLVWVDGGLGSSA